mmetsp:Transcript_16000/g.40618  ORF Transcript_16000/g.40618 Transcript_16000/m.40618 type:complete len:156 (-) Transcript_16000:61-528(-)
MQFFDKLEQAGLVSHNGHIKGRIEEDFEGIPLVNKIREAAFDEGSELYDTFWESDRLEFLYRIFIHLNVGGASNQYEDHVERYLEVTKGLFRDMLSVRTADSGEVVSTSRVLEVTSLGEDAVLFRKEHISNFCYVIIDPSMRHVTVWHFGYVPFW